MEIYADVQTIQILVFRHLRFDYGHNSYGEDGNDVAYGGDQNDALNGGNGDDRLYGEHGDDQILGDAGRDTLFGGIGNDWLSAGHGNDRLEGGTGNDYLEGNSGDNLLIGGFGADEIWSGSGRDVLVSANFDGIPSGGGVSGGAEIDFDVDTVIADTGDTVIAQIGFFENAPSNWISTQNRVSYDNIWTRTHGNFTQWVKNRGENIAYTGFEPKEGFSLEGINLSEASFEDINRFRPVFVPFPDDVTLFWHDGPGAFLQPRWNR